MQGKPPWLSRTNWANLFIIAGGVAMYFGMPQAQWTAIAPILAGVVNLGLRQFTGESIDWSGIFNQGADSGSPQS